MSGAIFWWKYCTKGYHHLKSVSWERFPDPENSGVAPNELTFIHNFIQYFVFFFLKTNWKMHKDSPIATEQKQNKNDKTLQSGK